MSRFCIMQVYRMRKNAEECGKETRIGKCVEQVICKYREFLWWDEVREELKVRDPLPEKFYRGDPRKDLQRCESVGGRAFWKMQGIRKE